MRNCHGNAKLTMDVARSLAVYATFNIAYPVRFTVTWLLRYDGRWSSRKSIQCTTFGSSHHGPRDWIGGFGRVTLNVSIVALEPD
jgi:hypothetical protein